MPEDEGGQAWGNLGDKRNVPYHNCDDGLYSFIHFIEYKLYANKTYFQKSHNKLRKRFQYTKIKYSYSREIMQYQQQNPSIPIENVKDAMDFQNAKKLANTWAWTAFNFRKRHRWESNPYKHSLNQKLPDNFFSSVVT